MLHGALYFTRSIPSEWPGETMFTIPRPQTYCPTPPPAVGGVITMHLQVPVGERNKHAAVSTPYVPLPGDFALCSVYVCQFCMRYYGTEQLAMECQERICKKGER